jgi:hypothetical protein
MQAQHREIVNMAFHTMFKMRPLPRAEYQLLKAMIQHLAVKDDAEIVTIALRVMYEVLHMHDVTVSDGHKYVQQIVNQYRSNPGEVREYEL